MDIAPGLVSTIEVLHNTSTCTLQADRRAEDPVTKDVHGADAYLKVEIDVIGSGGADRQRQRRDELLLREMLSKDRSISFLDGTDTQPGAHDIPESAETDQLAPRGDALITGITLAIPLVGYGVKHVAAVVETFIEARSERTVMTKIGDDELLVRGVSAKDARQMLEDFLEEHKVDAKHSGQQRKAKKESGGADSK